MAAVQGYGVSAGTGWPDVSILSEITMLIRHVCLGVIARTIARADPSLMCSSNVAMKQTANKGLAELKYVEE